MIAVDTNVVVRYLTNDDPAQARKALETLSGEEEVLMTPTVLLETEWVLRAVYGLSEAVVNQALIHLLGLPNVVVKHASEVAQALRRHAAGMDFADALHLAMAADARVFYSFDRKLANRAKGEKPVVEVPP